MAKNDEEAVMTPKYYTSATTRDIEALVCPKCRKEVLAGQVFHRKKSGHGTRIYHRECWRDMLI